MVTANSVSPVFIRLASDTNSIYIVLLEASTETASKHLELLQQQQPPVDQQSTAQL